MIADFKRCQHSLTDYECANNLLSVCECGEVGCQLSSSLYSIHIAKWLTLFPKNQFLFLRMEDMLSSPNAMSAKITKFLDIEPIPENTARNLLSMRLNKQKLYSQEVWAHYSLLNETRALLAKFFALYNRALADLTGDEFFLWSN